MDAIEALLGTMDDHRASDLFLCTGRAPAWRVDGRLVVSEEPPTTQAQFDALLDRIPAPGARARFEATGDLDAGLSIGDQRFRLNLSRQQGRDACVARALPSGALSMPDLGLPDAVRTFCEAPRGLVLVTGATGSGKSTTLAAMIHYINAGRPVHIVTIEDPIEFVHTDLLGRITQREVGSDTRTFHDALRHVVRQSPDVILIGEMRDAETMSVALSAAMTGHLVFASLHTIDATQTLQRILGYFSESVRAQAALDLSLALVGIVSQRLVPAKAGGRCVAIEVLTGGPAVSRLLREQRTDELADVMRGSGDPGMVTFNESLLAMYRAGRITWDAGVANASNAEEFSLWAKGMTTGVDGFRGAATSHTGLDLRTLLARVVATGASDLHLAVGRPPIVRVSGELQPLSPEPLSEADVRLLLTSIMSVRQRSAYEIERETDFALSIEGGRRFRVNAYFQKGHMAAALRAIPTEIPTAEALGLPPPVVSLGERPHGLLLVVGPTGSGKSTTLACLVDRINRTRACRIITVEDPIEYVHHGIRATVDQREIHADTRSFGAALKYILRQDPDVILVGEMRDLETVSAALTAAETGHLVLATLHTNDAAQAVDRIVDVFPPHQQGQVRTQLAACLLGVISQRLLPRADGAGRVGVFEVMVGTPAIRNLVRENKMHQVATIMEASRRDGCVTMDTALQDMVGEGTIKFEDAARFLRNPRALAPAAAVKPEWTPPPRR